MCRLSSTGVAAQQGVPEGELVHAAREGDVRAFEELYRRNVGRIHALCRRLCGDPGLAEELCQDAFVRAWQKLGMFRGESAFSSWLHRVAVNVVLGERRSRFGQWIRRVTALDLERPRQVAAPSAGASIDLERAISGLPHRARSVFVLHDIEGYEHDEIAQLAGMSAGTSKAHLHRARQLLKEALLA